MSDQVAIVVPYYKTQLSSDERLSWQHLTTYLGKYDCYLALPNGLTTNLVGFKPLYFDDKYFNSVDTYSRLLLSSSFYESFLQYRFILIYQLDCLIFSDALSKWCSSNYDYIGAPWFWFKGNVSSGFSRVGNGGLSLRKVESCLKVIESKRYIKESVPFLQDFMVTKLPDLKQLPWPQRVIKKLRVLRAARCGSQWYRAHYSINEDHFWSDRAKLFYPAFDVAPVDIGLQFAFEQFPRYCYEQNGRRLPFGAHAWAKWDRAFWKPYLLQPN